MPLVATLLANRGLDHPVAAAAFLRREPAGSADPFALPDMDRAVTRILRALREGEPICVYGDYDADGLTAAALLLTALGRRGRSPLSWHIPRRTAEGYGLTAPALEHIRESGAGLVVTVDCGVTAVPEAALARSLGLDLVITDHHEPAGELPRAVAVVDPRRQGSAYPFGELAGVGVAYKLAQALEMAGEGSTAGAQLEFFGENPGPADLLDLVALGTVADVVSLLDENRSLVHRGLALFNPERREGLRALRHAASLEGRPVGTYQLGYQFAPRINAAGRMGDPERALRLLLTNDPVEARSLAAELDRENRERQALEERILAEAVAQVEKDIDLGLERAIVVAGAGWPEGVIGIVATRLVELYSRPALLVAVNGETARGSGRSIPAFDLAGALEECSGRLGRHGGHRMAAGFDIGAEAIDDFRRDFLELARGRLGREDLVRELRIDACITPGDLTAPGQDVLRQLERLEPHGHGNPEPVLALRGVELVSVRTVGEGGRHLKAVVRVEGQAFEAIGFGLGSLAGDLGSGRGRLYDVAFRPTRNEWNGSQRLELKLVDVRPAGPVF